MRQLFFFPIIFMLGYSCSSKEINQDKSYERDCSCPMEEIYDQSTRGDSITNTNLKDPYDWSIDGTISSHIKGIINLELKGNIGSSDNRKSFSTTNIVKKISNDYPQLIDKAFAFKLKRVTFCTFYSLYCNDTSITEKELRTVALSKLSEFEQAIDHQVKEKTEESSSTTKPYLNYKKEKATQDKIILNPLIYTEHQSGGSNTVINQKLDVPEPTFNLRQVKVNSSIDSLFLNEFEFKLATLVPIPRINFIATGSYIVGIKVSSPSGFQTNVLESYNSRRAIYSFDEAKQGIYIVQILSQKQDKIKIQVN